MKQYKDHAVSPVVGVMLMLVVTIIIAAVVSGFAGGLVKGQTKAPTATITGTFSVRSGLAINHAGGSAIPSAEMVITTRDGPTFGAGLDSSTVNTVNLANVTNSAGTPIAFFNTATSSVDGYNVTSFNPGDTWYVNITNCNPQLLQPSVAPTSGTLSWSSSTGQWSFSNPTDTLWSLDFVNPSNVGKQFYLDINDKASGAQIARAVVTITG
jgi:FlaG/FlaF family flagellin (archaellin)